MGNLPGITESTEEGSVYCVLSLLSLVQYNRISTPGDFLTWRQQTGNYKTKGHYRLGETHLIRAFCLSQLAALPLPTKAYR